jgi:hypothetical protein
VDEISHKEFKNMFIRMINELKEERINAWVNSKKLIKSDEWNKLGNARYERGIQ